MIVEQATKEWLEYHYIFEERGYWKRCSRCGQIKLGHNMFFQRTRLQKMDFTLYVKIVVIINKEVI